MKTNFIETLKNPIGLSAGFDKDFNESPSYYAEQGFGWVEYGTVSLYPHAGNDNPIFFESLDKDYIINNLGLPTKGILNMKNRDVRLPTWRKRPIPAGMSIGFIHRGNNPQTIFRECIKYTAECFDYYTVNFSCPNIAKWYSRGDEKPIVRDICKISEEYDYPILLKLRPNLSEDELKFICEVSIKHNIAGLIATNTKKHPNVGGLSGRPLFEDANNTLESLNRITQGAIPLIGSGGILSPEDAKHKMKLGAKAIQVYTGYHFHGKKFITKLKQGVAK